MTVEELSQLRSMTKGEIMRKYWPALTNGLITAAQYEWVIKQGSVVDAPEPQESFQPETTHTDVLKGGSQKERLLNLLSDGNWHSTVEILHDVYGLDGEKGIARAGARIWDLKHDGHQIESRKASGTVWEYRLIMKYETGGNREGSPMPMVSATA